MRLASDDAPPTAPLPEVRNTFVSMPCFLRLLAPAPARPPWSHRNGETSVNAARPAPRPLHTHTCALALCVFRLLPRLLRFCVALPAQSPSFARGALAAVEARPLAVETRKSHQAPQHTVCPLALVCVACVAHCYCVCSRRRMWTFPTLRTTSARRTSKRNTRLGLACSWFVQRKN